MGFLNLYAKLDLTLFFNFFKVWTTKRVRRKESKMRSSRCVFSTASALHRVFVAPIEASQLQFSRRTATSTLSAFAPSSLFKAPRLLIQRRTLVSSATAAKSRLPRDDEIKSYSVSLVDEEGKLQDPRSTADILSSIDRKKFSLCIVVPGEPGVPPICKIQSKERLREAEKARQKAERNSRGGTAKTIELSWVIDRHDLGHRMDKLKGFLEKGWKVEVVCAKKRKGKTATPEEAEALVARIRDVCGSVVGSREFKPMEGKLLETVTLHLEGKAVKENKAEKEEEVKEEVAS
jgi:translation initiation factor IF-3